MDDKEQQLIHDIDVISDNIRKKYRTLKHGALESDEMLHKSYKPILEPLKTISQSLIEKQIKEEKPTEPLKIKEEKETEVDLPRFLDTPVIAETISDDDESEKIETMLNTPEGRREARKYFDSNFESDSLANKYMRKIVSAERKRLMDYTYGVRHENNQWMIGDSPLEIDEEDNFLIKGIRYKGTPGLYELMFMKHPDAKIYNNNDLQAYKTILEATNGHRLHYLPKSRINANPGGKYREIISQLFPPKYGHGHQNETYMKMTNDRIDYVHWNDPNELVERLRLLMESQRAGHSGHTNEIVSIIEELKEEKIIL